MIPLQFTAIVDLGKPHTAKIVVTPDSKVGELYRVEVEIQLPGKKGELVSALQFPELSIHGKHLDRWWGGTRYYRAEYARSIKYEYGHSWEVAFEKALGEAINALSPLRNAVRRRAQMVLESLF